MNNFIYLLTLALGITVLASCMPEEETFAEPDPWSYDEADIQTTTSGLSYVIHEEGDGAKPSQGNTVGVHYSGFLENGTLFDSSVPSGNPLYFEIGVTSLISGFEEGVFDMRPGERRTLLIPDSLGYGEEGAPPVIPANADLIFDVELLSVDPN